MSVSSRRDLDSETLTFFCASERHPKILRELSRRCDLPLSAAAALIRAGMQDLAAIRHFMVRSSMSASILHLLARSAQGTEAGILAQRLDRFSRHERLEGLLELEESGLLRSGFADVDAS